MSLLIQFVLLTVIVEFFIVWAFIRNNPLQTLSYVFLINLFSWPIAQLVYGIYPSYFLIVEIGVFLVESLLIWKLFRVSYKKAALISLVANLATALLGLFF